MRVVIFILAATVLGGEARAATRSCEAQVFVQSIGGAPFREFQIATLTGRGSALNANKARREAASNARRCIDDHTEVRGPAPASCRGGGVRGYSLLNSNILQVAEVAICCVQRARGEIRYAFFVETRGDNGCGGVAKAFKRRQSARRERVGRSNGLACVEPNIPLICR